LLLPAEASRHLVEALADDPWLLRLLPDRPALWSSGAADRLRLASLHRQGELRDASAHAGSKVDISGTGM
jgi:hypothetical protein